MLEDQLKAIEKKVDLITTKESDRWINNDELAQLLSVSKKTCQQYRDKGLLEFSQIGAKIYYKLSDVSAFLERHKVRSGNFIPSKKQRGGRGPVYESR